ncbi:hypothetical protein BN12_1740007 [Nostocoides japonicum T1-X7]|uniref:Uncharacterized protein n=1 Tax=Nostocoides japonicum T1-X7 TaxID=1194083 RepID=A0A077LZ37_9MICO|nr:hypothetical protein BN12_1740007 [Tetrasphaera japonica T1-X7]
MSVSGLPWNRDGVPPIDQPVPKGPAYPAAGTSVVTAGESLVAGDVVVGLGGVVGGVGGGGGGGGVDPAVHPRHGDRRDDGEQDATRGGRDLAARGAVPGHPAWGRRRRAHRLAGRTGVPAVRPAVAVGCLAHDPNVALGMASRARSTRPTGRAARVPVQALSR